MKTTNTALVAAPIAVLIACLTPGCGTPQRTAALECGAGGAGGAFLLCKALGGNDDTCMAMAAAGGGVGATVCYNYAGQLEQRRQALAGREDDLDAQLEYVRGLNQDAEQLNVRLRERVAEITRLTDDAVAKVGQGRMTQQQLQEQQNALDEEIATGRQQLAQGRTALDELKRYRARQEEQARQDEQAAGEQQAQRLRALDAELAKNEALLQEIERQTSALASQRQRV